MKKIIIIQALLTLSISVNAQGSSNSNLGISANSISGCSFAAQQKVSLIFDGTEKEITDIGYIYYNNMKNLNVDIQCSKGTVIDITTSNSPETYSWTYALKHTINQSAPKLLYTVYYRSNSDGITKQSSFYYSIYKTLGKQIYTIKSNDKQNILFDVRFPKINEIKYYEAGNYEDDFNLVLNF
jgi:hypothetical protein